MPLPKKIAVEGRKRGVEQAARPLNEVEEHILSGMGLDSKVVAGNVKDFYHRIGDMESDNNPDAASTISSAKGVYQFLNGNKKDSKGNPANSSFQTGLNRTARAYRLAGFDAPSWVADAQQHQDPRKLTQEQSDTVMLSDLVYGRKKVNDNMKKYFIYGQEDTQALHDVYSEHHTDITNTAEQGDVQGRMNERLGAVK